MGFKDPTENISVNWKEDRYEQPTKLILSQSSGGGGSGETNTASNVNTAGIGVFKQKTGVDLEFRGINAASSKVSVALDAGNNEVDIDIGTLNLNDLSNVSVASPSTHNVLAYNGSSWVASASLQSGVTDHGALTGLSDDDHSQYALLAGRSGGQTLYGGTAASNGLKLYSTSNATKGIVNIGDTIYVDQTNGHIGFLDVTSPNRPIDLELSTDGGETIHFRNTSAGTGAITNIRALNDANGGPLLQSFGSNYVGTNLAIDAQGASTIQSTSNATKLFLYSSTGPIHLGSDSTHAITIDTDQRFGFVDITSPSFSIHYEREVDAVDVGRIKNTSTGTGAVMAWQIQSDAGATANIRAFGSNYVGTQDGVDLAGAISYSASNASTKLLLEASTGPVYIHSDHLPCAIFDENQRVGIGKFSGLDSKVEISASATDDKIIKLYNSGSVERLQVNQFGFMRTVVNDGSQEIGDISWGSVGGYCGFNFKDESGGKRSSIWQNTDSADGGFIIGAHSAGIQPPGIMTIDGTRQGVAIGNNTTGSLPPPNGLLVGGKAFFGISHGSEKRVRIVPDSSGISYIQAGSDGSDTTAELTIGRMLSVSNIAQLNLNADVSSVNGRMGIGRSVTGGVGLEVEGPSSACRFYLATTGTPDIVQYYSDENGAYTKAAQVNADGTFATVSDERVKKDIVNINNNDSLLKINQLQPKRYKHYNSVRERSGFLAQDVEQVLDDVVSIDPEGLRAINYAGLAPYLVGAVKELSKEIEILKKKIK